MRAEYAVSNVRPIEQEFCLQALHTCVPKKTIHYKVKDIFIKSQQLRKLRDIGNQL